MSELQRRRAVEANTTHGLSHTHEYATWARIKDRCYNPKNIGFHRYGGRGITMCEAWARSFLAFYADMGPRPSGASLDRIDNNRGYEPGNCRWATPTEQANNRRSNRVLQCRGQSRTIAEWSRVSGVSEDVIFQRITKLAWPHDEAIFSPVRRLTRGRC